MNSIAQQELPLLEQTLNLRHELMDVLQDSDLTFKIDGNPTLGELLKQAAETEQQYADSFTTCNHDWTLTLDPGLATSVVALKDAFAHSEQAFKNALSGLSEAEAEARIIDRQHMTIPVRVQFHIYREAFLIYMAKVSVYLKAMGKPVPDQMATWIG